MLVQVAPDQYVNTDLIKVITIDANGGLLIFANDPPEQCAMFISTEAAEYILTITEASRGLATAADVAAPTLQSKIAQTLRDQYPYGATLEQLEASAFSGATPRHLGQDYNATPKEVPAVLADLLAERIAVGVTDSNGKTLYYHASNAPKTATPNPALSSEV